MANSPLPEKMINAMAAMVAAINNIRLYPPTSAMITNSIDKAYTTLQNSFEPNMPLLIAESENNLLISGEALSFKLQQLPQVSSFRENMASLRIKSIILKPDMSKGEFKTFLYILSKSADDTELEGGIQKVTSGSGLINIAITPRLYVASEQVRTGNEILDAADVDLIKAFLGERRINESDYMQIGEKALDSKWIKELFQTSISQMKQQGITLSDSLLPETLNSMIKAFEVSTPPESFARISSDISESLSGTDLELFSIVMAENYDTAFFHKVIDYLPDDQFVDLIAKISYIGESASYRNKVLTKEEIEQFHKVFEFLKSHKKTPGLKDQIKRKINFEKKKATIEKQHCERGKAKILTGDQLPLSDKVVMKSIPDTINKLFKDNEEEQAGTLINRIADGLLNESVDVRTLVSKTLLRIGERFSAEQRSSDMRRLSHRLNIWIKFEVEVTPSYEPVCNLLGNHVRNLVTRHQYSEANSILETFSFIYYGRIQKNDRIRAIAGNTLTNIASDKIFKLIFDEFRTNEHNEGKNAFYTLIRLGNISIEPLLDLLRSSDDMSQRVRIMNALMEIGQISLPYIVERLRHGSAWFYMRNLLKLLSQMGSEEHLEILKPMLNHDNPNVTKAALNCAFDIGGDDRFKFYIQSLNSVSEKTKSTIVDLLGKLGSEDAVFPLTELLKSKATESTDIKNELDLNICVALGKIGSKKAIPALKSIVSQKGLLGMGAYPPETRNAAQNTLKALQKLPTKAELAEITRQSLNGAKEPKPTKTTDAKTEDLLSTSPQRLEALVEEYIRQKNKPEAVRLLYKMIIKYAREKQFEKADELRSKLFEVDPMALNEIVKTGDIIEEEKTNSVINEYQNIWSNLYERLTEEEANALFFGIKSADFEMDQTIITQCENNSRLYFINRGQLKIVYKQNGNEFFLKMIGAGDIAGEDSFFPITVSTVSLITLSKVKTGYLDRDLLKTWKEKYPELEKKLLDFCTVGDSVNNLVTKKGLERRKQKRIDVTGKALVQLLDSTNNPMGKPFKGNLLDISTGGLSFVIKTVKKDTARMLLGRKLRMGIGISTEKKPIEISHVGTIIGAKDKNDKNFSIHMKFDRHIDESKMVEIASHAIPA